MADVQADITKHVQDFFRQFKGDITSVTLRVIKDALAPKFEDWAAVLEEHKAFLKEEARRLAAEVPAANDKAGDKEGSSFETPGKVEAESKAKDLKTTAKKNTKAEEDTEADESSSKRKKVQQEASSESEDAESESADGSDDAGSEDEPKPKKQKKKAEKKTKKASKGGPEKKAKTESASPLSAEVKRLKEIAKKLNVAVPVNVYKGQPSNDELEERLGDFLRGQGLKSLNAGPREISQLRNKIQLAKELDGIDTTNIVRGRRRGQDEEEEVTGAPPKTKYRISAVSDSDDDSS